MSAPDTARDMLEARVAPLLNGKLDADGLKVAASILADVANDLTRLARDPDTPGAEREPGEGDPDRAVLVRVSSVKAERVEWEWKNRIPRGKVSVLDGDPGLGKSTLMLDLIARRSRGDSLPGDERRLPPTGAVILSAEDGIGDTIRPRLEAAGADLDRIAVLTAVRDEKGRPRLPVLPEDLDVIREAVRKMEARLLDVDPMMAFLAGRVDSHRDQDVRGALAQLADLAEGEDLAVVIIRHLNKSQGGHPIYRGGGSIGIIGAARAGLLVAPDPKDETRRILAVSKSNLGPVPPSLAYRLVAAGDTSRIQWEGEADCSARDLLAVQSTEGEPAGARAGAEDFLRELLADGPVKAKDVRREARDAGVSDRTLDRAKAQLGVRATKAGGRFGGDPAWYWELPESLKDAKDANSQGWRPSGNVASFRRPDADDADPKDAKDANSEDPGSFRNWTEAEARQAISDLRAAGFELSAKLDEEWGETAYYPVAYGPERETLTPAIRATCELLRKGQNPWTVGKVLAEELGL